MRLGFESVGVDTRLLATRPGERTSTTLLAVETGGTRSSYHAVGAGGGASIDDAVVAAACASGFVHYAAVGGRATDGGPGAELLRAAKAAGAVVTCDLIGAPPLGAGRAEAPARLMSTTSCRAPPRRRSCPELDDLAAAAELFRALGAGACIIKNGRQGSYVSIGSRAPHRAGARDQAESTPPAAATSYCAGFIAALAQGWPPLDACRFATATAALVAQGLGTLGKLEGFAETEAAMRATALAEGT